MPPPGPPLPSTSWPLVWLICGAGMVAAFHIGKAASALALIRDELDLGLVAAGWVISIFNVVGIVGGMMLGSLADRLGHRRLAVSGFSSIALASALGAGAEGAPLLLATRFFEGLGFILVIVTVPGLLVQVARPEDHRLTFGVWSTYMPAGTAAIMLAAPAVIDVTGWRGLWLLTASLTAAAGGALWATTKRLPDTKAAGDFSGIARVLQSPGPWTLALAFAAYTAQFLAVLGFLPTILMETEGFELSAASSLGAAAIGVNVVGALGGGWLMHRGAQRWVLMAVTAAVMGLSAVGIYRTDLPIEIRYALCLVLSAIGGIIPAAVFAGMPHHAPAPNLVATTSGLVMQGSNLGQAIGPPAVAALAVATGSWAWSPLVLLALATACALFALGLRRLEER